MKEEIEKIDYQRLANECGGDYYNDLAWKIENAIEELGYKVVNSIDEAENYLSQYMKTDDEYVMDEEFYEHVNQLCAYVYDGDRSGQSYFDVSICVTEYWLEESDCDKVCYMVNVVIGDQLDWRDVEEWENYED